MVIENQDLDAFEQLKRRLTTIIYHYKQGNEYFAYECPALEYENYEDLRHMALCGSQTAMELPF
jgi:hypothetical protein